MSAIFIINLKFPPDEELRHIDFVTLGSASGIYCIGKTAGLLQVIVHARRLLLKQPNLALGSMTYMALILMFYKPS